MSAKINTGSVAVRALRPLRPKGKPWQISEGRVAADTAEDAVAFAAAICDSLRAHRDLEDARLALPTVEPAHCPGHDGGDVWCADGSGTSVHTGKCRKMGPSARGIFGNRTRINEMAATISKNAPSPVTRMVEKPRKAARPRKAPPAAPVMAPAIVATDASRDLAPCERCGRSDWRTANGRTWHVENNPDCGKYRKPDRHQYAAA